MGYLSWGGGNHMFLFEAEAVIIYKIFIKPASVFHPFVLLPMLGQIILMITVLQKKISQKLTLLGIACLFILIGFMFLIGLISMQFKILVSTIPFISLSFYAMMNRNK